MTGIIEDEIIIPGNGEIIPPEDKAAELFVPNGLDKILAAARQEVEQFQPDISTEKGRKAIASLARRVSGYKATVEEYGKNLSMAIKVQALGIDAERKRGKEAFDILRDQARKPLTDYEERVRVRVEAHEQALKDVAELSNVPFGASVAEIEGRIAKLDDFALRNWEEFSDRFSTANDATSLRLTGILSQTKQQEAEKAAFKKSEAERVSREAKEAEDARKKERTEREALVAQRAREDADKRAADAEAQRVASEKKAADDAASAEARHAAELKQAEEKRIREAKEADERAEASRQAAIEAERVRVADEARKAQEEATKRENNRKHAAKINNEVVASLVSECMLTEAQGKLIVSALAMGKIPHTKISY